MNQMATVEAPLDRSFDRSRLWPLRYLVAVILLVAAGLKFLDLPLELARGTAAFSLAIIALEWLLAVWLIAGWRVRLARLLAIGCFGLFAVVTLYRALQGEASCGCFGPIAVNPWYTLMLDLAVVGGLLLWRPPVHSIGPHGRAPLMFAGLVAAATVLIGGTMFLRAKPVNLDEGAALSQAGGVVILDPLEWLGKPAPVLNYIEGADALATGDWLVLFYKHDCEACQAAAGVLADEPREEDRRLAIVEIPPFGPADDPHLRGRGIVHLRLTDKYNWFMATPALLWLDQGRVSAVQEQSGPVERSHFRGR